MDPPNGSDSKHVPPAEKVNVVLFDFLEDGWKIGILDTSGVRWPPGGSAASEAFPDFWILSERLSETLARTSRRHLANLAFFNLNYRF